MKLGFLLQSTSATKLLRRNQESPHTSSFEFCICCCLWNEAEGRFDAPQSVWKELKGRGACLQRSLAHCLGVGLPYHFSPTRALPDHFTSVQTIPVTKRKMVYINPTNVDDYLVESITRPATDPNAGEVYYRLMTRFMSNQTKYTLDGVLSRLSCPLLLLWGDLDPWVGPAKAVRIKEFYPNTSIVNLQAGHCPHDEVPEEANKALVNWLSSLKLNASLQTV